jgi:hypothetical protein
VPYTGGNGGSHTGQTVTSTGVTGLTATRAAANFATGSGTLVYTITGTPATSGTASFVLNIGGQTCTLTRTVLASASITALNCSTATNNGTLGQGVAAASVSSSVPYTGGNGGYRGAQTFTSIGVTGLTATCAAGTLANGSGNLTFTITGTPASSGIASFALNIGGQTCTLNRTVLASAIITALNCSTATNNGTLGQGVAAASVSSSVPYTGGNGGYRAAQTFTSTGVTGLTATCAAGTLANGSGSLTFTITGTPASAGTASFALNIGGQTCTLTRTVLPTASITALSCSTATNNGTLTQGIAAASVNSSVPYTGGNGGYRAAQTFTSTGVTGLTATCAAGTLATGAGSLTFTITGTPASSGTASFALNIGGQTCTLTRTVNPPVGTITALSCSTATNTGTLAQGIAATSVSSSVPYTGGNGGTYTAQNVTSTGVTGLTATLAAGNFASGAGTLVYTITGTPASSGAASFAINIGGQTCTLTRTVNPPAGTITALSCSTATNTGTLTQGIAAASVSSSVPYTGGNGGTYTAQSITSTGVTGLTATLASGTLLSGAGSLTYIITGTPASSGTANFSLNIGGQTCTLNRTVLPIASITALNCSTATNNGTLTQGIAAASVNSSVPYTEGNGGVYTTQSIISTGVTGLTATRTAGTLATGSGSLTYTITGTPASSGTASFVLNIGGQTCTLSRTVGAIVTTYPAGTVFCNGTPTVIVGVTNPTTGKIWMDRNLGASQVASSSSDANAYGDLYQWGRRADGHQCRNSATTTTLSSVDQPLHGDFIIAFTSPFDWRSPQNTNLWQGINGVNNPCPSGYRLPTDTELEAERLSWSSNNAAGAFASALKLPVAGYRLGGDGSLGIVGESGLYWSGTFSSTVSRLFFLFSSNNNAGVGTGNRANGSSVRCIKDASTGSSQGTINFIDCSSTSNNGTLTSVTAASGVSSLVPYTGGNGGVHNGQTVSSTGVTGLTATLAAGTFATGAGNLTYTITGTPSASGTASFALNIGGQTCILSRTVSSAYPAGTVHCNGVPTAVVDVINPATGQIWMDRNLGASQVATSSTDTNSYGDLYQWGRRSDGHQCRNSPTTSNLSSTDQPAHGDFILALNGPNDWRSPQNSNLWQGVNGVNNPCPSGYRLPTNTEFYNESLSWSEFSFPGSFNSPLKLPAAGKRSISGDLALVGAGGFYYSSSVNGESSEFLQFAISFYPPPPVGIRAQGLSLRCIKN